VGATGAARTGGRVSRLTCAPVAGWAAHDRARRRVGGNLANRRYVASAFLNPDVVAGEPVAFGHRLPRHVVESVALGRAVADARADGHVLARRDVLAEWVRPEHQLGKT
jgi:hypothetical protein